MSELELNWVMNRMPPSDDKCLEIMSIENVEKARRFHKSFPQYSVTAMANLTKMAKYLGLGGIYVKDERFRFGLNAFKVLGASFAMGRYIAHEMGEHVSDITYDDLTSPELEQTDIQKGRRVKTRRLLHGCSAVQINLLQGFDQGGRVFRRGPDHLFAPFLRGVFWMITAGPAVVRHIAGEAAYRDIHAPEADCGQAREGQFITETLEIGVSDGIIVNEIRIDSHDSSCFLRAAVSA